MNIPDPLTLYRYQYFPGNVVLTIGNVDYAFRDGSVTYLNIIHMFVVNHMPAVQLGIEMETKLIQELYDNADEARMTIEIMERKVDQDAKVIDTQLYFKHTFSVVPAFEKGTYITTTDPEATGYLEVMRQLQNFELYLVDMDAINWFDKEYADHCTKVSREGMLQKLFVFREIPAGIGYTTPPLLTGIIPDVVIPLGDLVSNIDHMNTAYGLYDNTPIVYYDFNHMYCISKTKPNIVAPSATDFGTITFILLNPEKPQFKISGSNDDAANKTHWMNLQVEPHIDDQRTRDTSAKMSTLTSVNSKGKIEKETLDGSATRLKYIYSTNELTQQQVLNELMTGPVVWVRLENISVRSIKPYKDYTFEADTSYDNLDLNGHIFRILGWTLGIHREGAVEYLDEVTIQLYTPER